MKQNRLTSKVVWGAFISQLIAILILAKVIEPFQLELINKIIALALQLLVAFGVLNNGTDANHF